MSLFVFKSENGIRKGATINLDDIGALFSYKIKNPTNGCDYALEVKHLSGGNNTIVAFKSETQRDEEHDNIVVAHQLSRK